MNENEQSAEKALHTVLIDTYSINAEGGGLSRGSAAHKEFFGKLGHGADLAQQLGA